jgi:hypothetical protein
MKSTKVEKAEVHIASFVKQEDKTYPFLKTNLVKFFSIMKDNKGNDTHGGKIGPQKTSSE